MKTLVLPMEERFEEYLSDESRLKGIAESISFPESKEDILDILKELNINKTPITIQGGKTGIVGSAVPLKGHIMNLSRMNQVKEFIITPEGEYLITVQAGITLMELKQELSRRKEGRDLFWPPEPTEATATVGGVISSNGRGISGCVYGETSNYIKSIHVIQRNGVELNPDSNSLQDIYIGGEGMYGVITEATLVLKKRSKEVWGITFFFFDDEDVFRFTDLVKKLNQEQRSKIFAMEYMDRRTIDMIQEHKVFMSKIKDMPDVEEDINSLIYMEIHGNTEEVIEEVVEFLMEMAYECNSDPELAWAVSGESEVERMRDFRHGAAEASNLKVEKNRLKDKRITKLGSDMCLEHGLLSDVFNQYQQDLVKNSFDYCIFGHIPDNHLHVNIFPKTYEEYCIGKQLMEEWAGFITKKGGCPIVEHGVGKLKKELFCATANKEYLTEIEERKLQMDPEELWNPGNMFTIRG